MRYRIFYLKTLIIKLLRLLFASSGYYLRIAKSPKFLEKPWKKFYFINIRLIVAVLLLIIGSSWLGGYWIYSYIYQEIFFQTFVYVLIVIDVGAIIFLLYQRKKGNRLYHQFLDEVAQRITQQHSLELTRFHTRILKTFLWWSSLGWIKLALLLILFAFVYVQISEEFKKINLQKPEKLSILLTKNIQKNQSLLTDLEKKIHQNKSLQQSFAVRIRVNERLIRETQYSIFQQYQALSQATHNRGLLAQIQSQILQKEPPHNTSEAEILIRNHSLVLEQIKGMVEVQFFLEEKAQTQAESLLNQEGNLFKGFQDLIRKSDFEMNKAQKSIQRDNLKIQQLKEEIKTSQKLFEQISQSLKQDSILKIDIQKRIKQLNLQRLQQKKAPSNP